MKLQDICCNIAFKLFEVGDFLNCTTNHAYLYKVLEKGADYFTIHAKTLQKGAVIGKIIEKVLLLDKGAYVNPNKFYKLGENNEA